MEWLKNYKFAKLMIGIDWSLSLSIYIYIYMCVCMCLSLSQSLCVYRYLFEHPSVSLHLSGSLSVSLSLSVFVSVSVSVSVSLPNEKKFRCTNNNWDNSQLFNVLGTFVSKFPTIITSTKKMTDTNDDEKDEHNNRTHQKKIWYVHFTYISSFTSPCLLQKSFLTKKKKKKNFLFKVKLLRLSNMMTFSRVNAFSR